MFIPDSIQNTVSNLMKSPSFLVPKKWKCDFSTANWVTLTIEHTLVKDYKITGYETHYGYGVGFIYLDGSGGIATYEEIQALLVSRSNLTCFTKIRQVFH